MLKFFYLVLPWEVSAMICILFMSCLMCHASGIFAFVNGFTCALYVGIW